MANRYQGRMGKNARRRVRESKRLEAEIRNAAYQERLRDATTVSEGLVVVEIEEIEVPTEPITTKKPSTVRRRSHRVKGNG